VKSIEELAAFRTIERNLGATGESAEPTLGAEITASAFSIARVLPLLGRTLIDTDEQDDAIGSPAWIPAMAEPRSQCRRCAIIPVLGSGKDV